MVKGREAKIPYPMPTRPNATLRRRRQDDGSAATTFHLGTVKNEEGNDFYIRSASTILSGFGTPQTKSAEDNTALPTLVTPISQRFLTNAGPRQIVAFLERREAYLLEVAEKNKKGGIIAPAS